MVSKKKQKAVAGKKKSKSAPKINPFELKFNRLKHNVGFVLTFKRLPFSAHSQLIRDSFK